MQKLLTYWTIGASLLLTGCSTFEQAADAIPASLESTSLMYKPDIQQGNVIEQGTINRLQPGMTKSQVNYLMGTPMLTDVFHQDRWDYIYSLKRGRQKRVQQRVTLFFENERLVRIDGDLRPGVEDPVNDVKEAEIYDVPDNPGEGRGIFSSLLDTVGLEDE